MSNTSNYPGMKPFRFEPFWQRDPMFKQLLMGSWSDIIINGNYIVRDFQCKLNECTQKMKHWSNHRFGSLPKRIKILQEQISQLNSFPDGHSNSQKVRDMEFQLDQLLELNESYWKQRSRADWLAGGNRNTKFFHHKASVRHQNNKIIGIQSDTNGWTTNACEVNDIFLNYYHSLFTTSNPTSNSINIALSGIQPRVTDQMRNMLDMPYNALEFKTTLFRMAPWKAPGPDGFHAGFFQNNWELVGENTTSLCLKILNGDISIGALNTNFLILIPKVKNPRIVADFCPISLCNVISKVVAKVMANRLKCHLQELIDHEQSAFVPRRLITDNILMAFECLHTIRRRKNGRTSLMAIKIDMNKAYDRLNESILVLIMYKLGFSQSWIDRVMDLLKSTRFSILVNGKHSAYFQPSRGLRQGCPLSPYLFLLCSQGLSSLLNRQSNLGNLCGVNCARNAPSITHLFSQMIH